MLALFDCLLAQFLYFLEFTWQDGFLNQVHDHGTQKETQCGLSSPWSGQG
jgi:hypothetical protein